jgi:hypothetical protein
MDTLIYLETSNDIAFVKFTQFFFKGAQGFSLPESMRL